MNHLIINAETGFPEETAPEWFDAFITDLKRQETSDPPAAPLDATGALATLLAVESVLTVEDAANAVGLTPADLITEAEAWAAASSDIPAQP